MNACICLNVNLLYTPLGFWSEPAMHLFVPCVLNAPSPVPIELVPWQVIMNTILKCMVLLFINAWMDRLQLCSWRCLFHVADDASISEDIPSVVLPPHSKSASPSPIVGAGSRKGPGSVSSGEWPPSPEEDIDRLVAIHQQRSSLSSLGVSILNIGSSFSHPVCIKLILDS